MPAEALAAEVRRDLERLGLPARHWTAREPGGDLLDVLVVGAGMCGIAAAAALAFKGVRNLALIDQASHGLEGPWRTTARMRTLRSPKHLPGIALGIPSLSFRAWYEATRGLAAWDALYKIANDDWMDYLVWLTGVLALPLSSGVALRLLDHEGAHLLAELSDGRVLRARHVVLATGRDGAGGPGPRLQLLRRVPGPGADVRPLRPVRHLHLPGPGLRPRLRPLDVVGDVGRLAGPGAVLPAPALSRRRRVLSRRDRPRYGGG